MLHGHGDDGYRYGREFKANFSSNVWLPTRLEALRDHLFARFNCVTRYPEAAGESLESMIAEIQGVRVDNLLMCNGATAGIYTVAHALHGRRSTVVFPTFSEYEDACRVNGHALDFLQWDAFVAGAEPAGDVVWVCNPDNPTGAALSADWLRARIDGQPGKLWVIDQAYMDFCLEPALALKEVLTRPNLILVRSKTKRFGIPGLRLGYVAASAEHIRTLARFSPPWSLNVMAIEAGKFLLKDRFEPVLAEYLAETQRFRAALATIPGVEPLPTQTGYFLVRLPADRDSTQLKNDLIEQHDILIRDAANFRGLDHRYVRLATQKPEHNQLLVEALRAWMAE